MARQDNPFALLVDDDEGDDVSVLLAKVEAMIPSPQPASSPIEQTKQKIHAPNELVRGERGRGRGGRGRGLGRGIDQPENMYDRSYGGRGGNGRGRGRSFAGFGSRNAGDGELGGELREKSYYGDGRQSRYDARRFGEENRGENGEEEGEKIGYDVEKRREFREGEGFERSYGGDGESRGFRGGEGRGRGYGGRGWRGGRDGGRGGGGRYESNDGWNATESKKGYADEKEPAVVDNTNNGDGVSGRYGIFSCAC